MAPGPTSSPASVFQPRMKTGGRGPDDRVVWGAGLSSFGLQVADSNPVAARSCDPVYHQGFGNCCLDLRMELYTCCCEYTVDMGEN